MSKTCTAALLIVLCSTAFSADTAKNTVIATLAPSAPATKIESALARKGRIIIKDVYSIAETAGLRQERIRFTDICVYEPNQESSKLKALKIEIIDQRNDSQSVFLDSDEIPALIKTLDTLSTTAITWKNQNREFTEISYTTRAGLTIGFIQRALEQRAFLSTSDNPKCFLPAIDSLKTISENASKCLSTLNEK